ncbi:MAG TPA: aminotransferase class IV [Herpetosiphonaceae bacterium]
MSVVYVDGTWAPQGQAAVPIDDLGLVRGLAVFETIRVYAGAPFRLEAHLRRLADSCASLRLPWRWEPGALEAIVAEAVRRNAADEGAVKILVTGGSSASDGRPRAETPRLVVSAWPLLDDARRREAGVALITYPHERWMPTLKTVNYAAASLALQDAEAAGAWDALYVGRDGAVSECTMRNFFGVRQDGTLVTPAADVLLGVTRAEVIDISRELALQLDEGELWQSELAELAEAFMTSTLAEITPVIAIDGRAVGAGQPGPLTRRIQAAFAERIRPTRG